ncbi:non-canonical poly(A) RNA polymerase protein Trf4-1 [Galendromus occidentalis]|uniref:polynucleotide adenylyltransferase n=1 Tax=Galendromus occidentalis TaxID=34638 RepID=A0AAJ6QXQ2_9ACAR|nr:non-canonical poly(A) RNA polymerase protein Trf4-1 [Galendromus occidentalis]
MVVMYHVHDPSYNVWSNICQSADLNGMYAHPGMTPQNLGIPFYAKRPYPARKFQSYVVNVCPEVPPYDASPWRSPNRSYSLGLEGLTEEIHDFFMYAQPNAADQSRREQVIEKVRAAIREKWPDCVVEVFGSYKTGLYLPTGDIDMVIQGNWEIIPPLFDLERQLIEKKVGEKNTFKVLDKASVPLIKFKDADTEIRVDLSFNQANCTEAAAFVKQCCRTFPPLAKLIFVLKQYLSLHGLNEVFHGGISSYSLTLMILSFLQLHPEQEMVRSDKPETGKLLVEFLEFYGDRFEYDKMGIRIRDGGALVDKNQLRECLIAAGGPPSSGSNLLCIEDPLTPGNDVARSSYAMSRVRDAFKSAFTCLSKLVHPSLFPMVGNPRPPTLTQMIAAPNGMPYGRIMSPYPEEYCHTKSHSNRGVRGTSTEYSNSKPYPVKKRQRKWSEDRSDKNRAPAPMYAANVEDQCFDIIINGPQIQADRRKGRAVTESPKPVQ